MTNTTNLGLKKPGYNDAADIADINDNMDIIDTKMGAVGATSLQAQIGTTAMGTTATTVKGAIKEHSDKIGSSPMGTTATTLTGAIAEHEGDLTSQSQAIGNLSNLTTTEKGSLVGAANELNSKTVKLDTVTITTAQKSSAIGPYTHYGYITIPNDRRAIAVFPRVPNSNWIISVGTSTDRKEIYINTNGAGDITVCYLYI